MGIAPDIWGPSAWKTIHLLCLGAPETLSAAEQLHYTLFFNALAHVLPCATCSGHYLEHLKTFPVEASVLSRESLFEWSVNIHNAANQMLGKPILSLEEAKRYWAQVISSGGNSAPVVNKRTSYWGLWLLIGLLSILIVAVVLLKKKNKKRT